MLGLHLFVLWRLLALDRQVVLGLHLFVLGRFLALRQQAGHLRVADLTLQREERVLGCPGVRPGGAVGLAAQRGLAFR